MATSTDCPQSELQEQEEEPMGFGEAQLLQESMQPQPEEFVAIADYAATDETQLSFFREKKFLS